MAEIAIGIDIGTSYTKAAARLTDGTVVKVCRRESPKAAGAAGLIPARGWWSCLRAVIRELLQGSVSFNAAAICISSMAPTLTVFDLAHREHGYSILYSSLVDMPAGASLAQCDGLLTTRRLETLRNIASNEGFISPAVTDLSGYLNWCLTDQLTINSISWAEMGMAVEEQDCSALCVAGHRTPKLVAAGSQIGETSAWSAKELRISNGIPVCGGCPDTMGSVVGAGLRHAGERMLYLGTFGSLLCLDDEVDSMLDGTHLSTPPFRWSLSVPGLGPKLEQLAREWFGVRNVATGLRQLDSAAAESTPGAGGSLFLVPRWKDGMKEVGDFSFIAGHDGQIGDVVRRSRAVLESVGYALLVIAGEFSQPIKVSGGGARSRTWLAALSSVLGTDLLAQDMSWEASGTADIAARLIWKDTASRPWRAESVNPSDRHLMHANLRRVSELYQLRGWI